jgi:uncharacterized membrane protein (DUF2068 family)
MSAADGAARPLARFGMLRIIALYKLVKVSILVLAAWGELHLHDATLTATLLSWAANRPHGLEHNLVTKALVLLSGMSESRIHALRLLTLTYAAVFAVEGVGLWMQQRWAEWLTTIVTASLIPLEVWELVHNPSIGAGLVVIANTLIAVYLYWHVSTHQRPAPPLKSPAK